MPTSSSSSTTRSRRAVSDAHPVKLENLADLPLDHMQRVERGHRLLKHHGDASAAQRAQSALIHLQHVLAGEMITPEG